MRLTVAYDARGFSAGRSAERERMADVVTIVRHEAPADHAAVYQVNCTAFPGTIEAALVDKLRGSSGCVSLVAVEAGSIVGHILCTPVRIDGPASDARTAGLGPMAVVPKRQRCGIGSRLVRHALEECRRMGYQAVVAAGVLMALELQPGVLARAGGEVKYAAEFSEA